MFSKILSYPDYLKNLPNSGAHIVGHQTEDSIVLYQAFRDTIANYAVEHQKFGGADYKFTRMSWIKPNFLWMMYRCGWDTKEGQQRVLAIWISKQAFDEILEQAVISSYNKHRYPNHEDWKNALANSDVRLQWDPDHDPFGNKLDRRAIQLGLRGKVLEKFVHQDIQKIEEVTDFVNEQRTVLENGGLENLVVPLETVYAPFSHEIAKHVGAEIL